MNTTSQQNEATSASTSSKNSFSGQAASAQPATDLLIASGQRFEGSIDHAQRALIQGEFDGEFRSTGLLTADVGAHLMGHIQVSHFVAKACQVEAEILAESVTLAAGTQIHGTVCADDIRIEDNVHAMLSVTLTSQALKHSSFAHDSLTGNIDQPAMEQVDFDTVEDGLDVQTMSWSIKKPTRARGTFRK